MDPKLNYSLAKFAFKFCNELQTQQADSNHKTTICSPLSAEIVLAILALGCKGKTRAELMQALDLHDDAFRSSFALVTSSLRSIKGATLSVANKVYVRKGFELRSEIKEDVEETFQSSLEQISFKEKEAAAGIINKWVEENTNGLIKRIVSRDDFNKDSCLILINAIYFKGNWAVPFKVINTEDRNFHVDSSTTIQVPMMYNTGVVMNYGAIPELKAKILEMFYEGNEASMVVVLPDEIEGLNSVLQLLAGGHDLLSDVEALESTKVSVMIPKFKVETEIDLEEILRKMDINSIFDTANICMLTTEYGLRVSKAVQKAFIVVDETGTEAAAATYIHFKRIVKRGPSPKRFIADRPFLYLLMVRGIPLFAGVYEGSQFAVPPSTGQAE